MRRGCFRLQATTIVSNPCPKPVSRREHGARVASISSLLACVKGFVMPLDDPAPSPLQTLCISRSLSLSPVLRADGCGYAQVYFPADVELAVERNATRGKPVAETVRQLPAPYRTAVTFSFCCYCSLFAFVNIRTG